MLQNSFYAILGTFYTLLNNTDLNLSYFILSYVFLGHNDSVEWGLTVVGIDQKIYKWPDYSFAKMMYFQGDHFGKRTAWLLLYFLN